MSKKRKDITQVREHPRTVPVSKKNPDGITVVDQHLRRLKGTYLDRNGIASIFNGYDRKGLVWPTVGKLNKYRNADKYDELIAVWVDYFNKKFGMDPPLDPDVVKALIASESGFRVDPPENKGAFGVAQITRSTWKILQDASGETSDFIFDDIRQKDLKEPNVPIPMATRWLCRKADTARSKLRRAPSSEELILEYKGLLKSSSPYKDSALTKFREVYGELKKK